MLCAFCGKVEIDYRSEPDGSGGVFESQSGERHYDRCPEWQEATR